jgi:hypothetical protein
MVRQKEIAGRTTEAEGARSFSVGIDDSRSIDYEEPNAMP